MSRSPSPQCFETAAYKEVEDFLMKPTDEFLLRNPVRGELDNDTLAKIANLVREQVINLIDARERILHAVEHPETLDTQEDESIDPVFDDDEEVEAAIRDDMRGRPRWRGQLVRESTPTTSIPFTFPESSSRSPSPNTIARARFCVEPLSPRTEPPSPVSERIPGTRPLHIAPKKAFHNVFLPSSVDSPPVSPGVPCYRRHQKRESIGGASEYFSCDEGDELDAPEPPSPVIAPMKDMRPPFKEASSPWCG